MASTYSDLKFELIGTGDQSGTWGITTNDNIGTAIEQAIVGLGNPIFTTDANLTITLTNTVALQTARALVLNATSSGSLTATRELVVPTIEKQYIVQNNTTGGQSITVKTSAGTGITVPNGKKMHLYVDGVNVVDAVSHFSSLTLASALPVLSGGTGVTTSTGTTNVVLSNSPTLVTPALGTPASAVLTNATGLPISTGVSGLGTGVATFLGTPSSANLAAAVTDETGTGALVFATSPTLVTPALGTPASGTVTNLTGTASININGTVGATTASTGAFTTLTTSSTVTHNGGTANGVAFLNASKVLTTGSALTFDGTNLGLSGTGARFINLGTTSTNGQSAALQISAPNSDASASVYRIGSGLTADNELVAFDVTSAQTVDKYIRGSSGFRAFFQNGSEQMRLTSTGLGIGTTAPSQKLEVYATANSLQIESVVRNDQAGSGVAAIGFNVSSSAAAETTSTKAGIGLVRTSAHGVGSLCFYNNGTGSAGNFTTADERMRIDSSGNVGIGTSSPTQALTVNGQMLSIASSGASFKNITPTTGNNYMWLGNIGNNFYVGKESSSGGSLFVGSSAYAGVIGNDGAYPLQFATNNNVRATIDSAGKVGIGTSSPSQRFVVSDAGADNILMAENTAASIQLYMQATSSTGALGTLTNHALNFLTNNIERARIDSSGNLLVGTTSGGAHVIQKSHASSIVLSIINSSATSPSGTAFIFSAAAPNNGNQTFFTASDTGGYRGGWLSNGGVQNFQSNDSNLSDRREKTNFSPAKSYLDTICAIPVQTFNYIDQNMEDDPGLTLGVVAQDVQAVAPELIMESNWAKQGDDPKMRLSIYQTDLQYALMKCIQEQQALITALTARITALESN